jgi:hypothetical protein
MSTEILKTEANFPNSFVHLQRHHCHLLREDDRELDNHNETKT